MRFLQLVQQKAGISRRKSRRLIEDGQVELNGEIFDEPFVEMSLAAVQELKVRGITVPLENRRPATYKYFKPRGTLSSHRDPHHVNTLGPVLRKHGLKGYALAGRLDRDAEGLIVLSNDGRLINFLTHPRFEVAKVYQVTVPQSVPERHSREVLRAMERGVRDGRDSLQIKSGRVADAGDRWTTFELTLLEGKKHEIKRLFKHFGLPVAKLLRTAIGPLELGDLRRSELRAVTKAEASALDELKGRVGGKPGA